MPQQQDRRTQSSRTLIRRFWPYMRPYRKTLCVDLFCAALTTVCELVLPLQLLGSILAVGFSKPKPGAFSRK